MSRILIAEDVPQIVRFLTSGLRAAGFVTSAVDDGALALELALGGHFDLMLLDLSLPGLDGFEVLNELRARRVSLPIIIVTARNASEDIVRGLDAGADDYLTKPFRLVELLARIRLRLRLQTDRSPEEFVLRAGDVELDLRTRLVTVAGRPVELSGREFALAAMFVQHPGHVLSREQLLSHIWGYDHDPGSNIVEVYIRYLRNKIGAEHITTVRGAGYRFTTTPTRLEVAHGSESGPGTHRTG